MRPLAAFKNGQSVPAAVDVEVAGTAPDHTADAVLHIDGDEVRINLTELRAAAEMRAFDKGVVIPGGKGTKVGRRSL